MVGLPNMHVIPPGWQDAHRPTAVATMTGICRIEDTAAAGPPVFGAPVGEALPLLAQDLPCRIQQVRGEANREQAEQSVDTRRYLVSLPLDLVPDFAVTDAGPVLRVTGYKPGHEGDPFLVGRALRVTNVQRGTLVWERDLSCVDDLTNGGRDVPVG